MKQAYTSNLNLGFEGSVSGGPIFEEPCSGSYWVLGA